jgi:acyl-CoA thioesterase
MPTAQQVVNKMMESDTFSQLLGLQVDEVRDGYCKLHFAVTDQMVNGLGVLHGGVTYAAADSAFAFASNSYNRLSLGLSVTIDYFESGKIGDIITAEATEESLRNKTNVYTVRVANQNGTLIALFKGTGYRTNKVVIEE